MAGNSEQSDLCPLIWCALVYTVMFTRQLVCVCVCVCVSIRGEWGIPDTQHLSRFLATLFHGPVPSPPPVAAGLTIRRMRVAVFRCPVPSHLRHIIQQFGTR